QATAAADRRRMLPSLVVLAALGAVAIAAPFVAPGGAPRPGAPAPSASYATVRLDETLEPPSAAHPFGTDLLGRDLLARVLYGARVALLVGFGAPLLALLMGALLGGGAGLRGGRVDFLLGRLIEVFGCFPAFILALALVTVTGSGLPSMVAAIGAS